MQGDMVMMMGILDEISKVIRDTAMDMTDLEERGREVCMGADGTPTTGIDKAAEDAVLRFLDDNDVPLNVLSEEAGHVDRGHESTLVMDPIDGTYNSIMGVPLYTASLAVGRDSMRGIETGLIRNLVTDDVFKASRGEGAFRNGRRIRTRRCDPERMVMVLYLGRSAHPDTFELLRRAMRTRAYGCASIEMCLVAQGCVDVFYMNSLVRAKSIRVIDIAASQLILREAGGEMFDLGGRPLDMPLDLDARENFLAIGQPDAKGSVL